VVAIFAARLPFFLLYFLIVEMRVLGLVFLMNQHRFDGNRPP